MRWSLMLALLLVATVAAAMDLTVTWTHSPTPTVTGYRIYTGLASRQYSTTTDVGYVTQAALGGLSADVRYFLTVTALSPDGESAYANEVSILKPTPVDDQEPPLALITSPRDGATVPRNAVTEIIVDASDNVGVVSVEVAVNGMTKCSVATAPYRCAWRVPAQKKRTYLIEAMARDQAGHIGTAPPITVKTP